MMNDDAGRHPRDLLSPYLDGELGPDERARVTAHLEQCAACGALLDDLRTLAAGIAAEEPPPAPADLAARIGRRVGALAGESKIIPIRRSMWHSPLVFSSVAAVLAGIMATVVWYSARPPLLRQEPSVALTRPASSEPPADQPEESRADGRTSGTLGFAGADKDAGDDSRSTIGAQKKKVSANVEAERAPIPLPQSAQETMSLMEENAARVEQPTAAPPPAEPPRATGKEQVGADDRLAAADVAAPTGRAVGGVSESDAGAPAETKSMSAMANLDALGYVAGDRREGSAPGGPPVAEPPPSRSLELRKSEYRAVLSEAGALTFVAGAYECVIPVTSPVGGVVPPSSPADLRAEIRQIFALAAAEESRRAATEPSRRTAGVTEEERARVGALRDALVGEEAQSKDLALQVSRLRFISILTYRDANEVPLYWETVPSEQGEGAASLAAPIAARLDRLIREHYLALMERGCGPLPPEVRREE